MEKVKLTKFQSALLNELKKDKSNSEIVSDFVKEAYTVVSPIYDLSLDNLIRALYFGYEVID